MSEEQLMLTQAQMDEIVRLSEGGTKKVTVLSDREVIEKFGPERAATILNIPIAYFP